jgi:hypothetical protein
MGFSIFAGGVLNLLHWSRPFAVSALVLGGCAIQLFLTVRTWERPCWKHHYLWYFLLALPLLLQYAAAVIWPGPFNLCDDYLAYMAFPRRMLETGTFLDPFSVRRIAAYGGNSFLQAQIQIVGAEGNSHLLDIGLCPLIIAALVLGHLRPRRHRDFAVAMLLVWGILSIEIPRTNTMSALTGATLFLALFRTMAAADDDRSSGKWEIVTAITAAAVSTIRATYWPAALGALVLAELAKALETKGHWGWHVRRLARVLGYFILCLAPWMILHFLSSHSFLYPLMLGNHQPNYTIFSRGLTFSQTLAWISSIFGRYPITILLVLPGLLGLWWKRSFWRNALPFCATLFSVCLVIIGKFNWIPEHELLRHIIPFILPVFIVALLAILGDPAGGVPNPVRMGAAILALWILAMNLPRDLQFRGRMVTYLREPRALVFQQALRDYYRRIQESVPPGKAVFSVVDHPFLFDLGRNPVSPVDVVGACSPPPGMPFFKGPAALKAYLRSLALDYVAVVDFKQSIGLYSRKAWIGHSHGDDHPIYQFESPYFFDFMDNMEALQRTERLVFAEGPVKVLQLR